MVPLGCPLGCFTCLGWIQLLQHQNTKHNLSTTHPRGCPWSCWLLHLPPDNLDKKGSLEPLGSAYTSSVSATAREAPFKPSACGWLDEEPFPRGMSEGTYFRLNLRPALSHPRGVTAGVPSVTHSIYLLSQAQTAPGMDLPEQHNTHREGVEGRGQECDPAQPLLWEETAWTLGWGCCFPIPDI